MQTIYSIFKRDFKRIIFNPVALIVTIGVCIIPSLYAWFNIAANWDPYANTAQIPIAIVNQDKGVTTDSKGYTNVGDMVVAKLKENKELDWNFCTEQEALDGVKAGTYYAAIEMGSKFSEHLASPITGKLETPTLIYYVNEKKNAIAPKVTDTGADTIEDQINSEFAGTVAEIVAHSAQDLLAQTEAKGQATQSAVISALKDARDATQTLDTSITQAKETLTKAGDTLKDAKQTLASLNKTSISLADTLDVARTTLSDVRSSTASFQSQISGVLVGGAQSLSGVSADTNKTLAEVIGQLSLAHTKAQATIDHLQSMADNHAQVQSDIEAAISRLPVNGPVKKSLLSKLEDIKATLASEQATIADLKAKDKVISDILHTLTSLNNNTNTAIQTSSQEVIDLQDKLNTTTIPALSKSLDTVAFGLGSLTSTASNIQPLIASASDSLDALQAALAQAQSALDTTQTGIQGISSTLDTLIVDVLAIQSSNTYTKLQNTLNNSADLAEFMRSPVTIEEEAVFGVSNYGSGVAPFYTSLALWVGGFVLVAIYKLEVDTEDIGDFKPYQGYFGRCLLLVILGQLQAIICCIGDLVLGIQCLHPVLFVAAGMFASFIFINIIYALSIAFKHIGKAVAVLLVILQIPGSSGMYPIEMMPKFFQTIYPWLPFSYSIRAMRETIAGMYGTFYIDNLLMLVLFLIPALIIGVVLRRNLLNINALFDRKLAETDMMIADHPGLTSSRFKLATVLKAALNSETYQKVLMERAARFEILYPIFIRRGIATAIVVPLILTVLLFVVHAKLAMLIIWIVAILLICAFLIGVEYIHERINTKTELSKLTQDELWDMLDKQLKDEVMASAPLERMLKEANLTRLRTRQPKPHTDTTDTHSDTH